MSTINDDAISKKQLNDLLDSYKAHWKERWKNESFKWVALKCFQDNWDINAPDFSAMFKKATEKTDSLLAAPNSYPRGMILDFAKVDQEATRAMFAELYDESKELQGRIATFRKKAEDFRESHDPGTWKSHFQSVNVVSTYLWLRYPAKYFIYKLGIFNKVAECLGFEKANGNIDAEKKAVLCFEKYDKICSAIKTRQDICDMIRNELDETCFSDDDMHTVTLDFAHYLGKYYDAEKDAGKINPVNTEDLMNILKNYSELIPDEHDGSYELMRETINAYAQLEDFSAVDYTDLDLIYLMAIITSRDNGDNKKERIMKNHLLTDDQKGHLTSTIDHITENVSQNKYSNIVIPKSTKEKQQMGFGMFGTGFYTFKPCVSDSWTQQIQEFIHMLTEIRDMTDDDEIFKCAEKIVKYPIKGFGAGVLSVILHCLKPYTFPIINGNEKMGDIFSDLGISLKQKRLGETYIANCRNIKSFRDKHFVFKNYRIFDLVARKVYENDGSKEYYPYVLTVDQWKTFLKEDAEKYPKTLVMLRKMLELGGETSCKQLSDELGENPTAYVSRGSNFGKRARKRFDLPEFYDENGDKWEFLIPFNGRRGKSEEGSFYFWSLKPELKEALEAMNGMENKDNLLKFDHNIILYGPPGTGKTYYTAYYAVAICEGISLKKAFEMEYADVLTKYNAYKEQNRIAFTTFHQSYGYEEFIEGIRPIMAEEGEDGEETGEVRYEIKPGAFKKFCDNAGSDINGDYKKMGLNDSPVVWKVSLGGAGDNEVRRDCLENNRIRIGWDEYGPDVTQETQFSHGGRIVLNAFYNKMRIGDIVVSCYSSELTDAIGVVTGDGEWDDSFRQYKRVRRVKWIIKGIKESVLNINGNKLMMLASVYKMDILPKDILSIVRKYKGIPEGTEKKQNYVFIIDEINRGNISKIFGELITLIEDGKRIGASEEMTVKLPYSGKPFGVPSNVYIIGTMNTADRSIALMDTALRRRFRFIEKMPEPSILKGIKIEADGQILDVSSMLDVINKRVECLYDREHTIGHAFFTPLRYMENPSVAAIRDIFEKSIIPLLQEYFYEDYEKIRLVLGDNAKEDEGTQFITRNGNMGGIFRGKVSEDDYNEFSYKINKNAFGNILSYMGIIGD